VQNRPNQYQKNSSDSGIWKSFTRVMGSVVRNTEIKTPWQGYQDAFLLDDRIFVIREQVKEIA